ncbi:elongator complex protein 6-like, partial [Stegodyphus dumicola]|uniref:elongator complex protein 6-like n=1 Tax=Stegodyphus dumicola TaxID=202533 RepID=UPI0015B22894
MTFNISNSLDLASGSKKRQFVLVTRDAFTDSTFVFADILSCYSKQNYSFIIVNLSQSYNHYNHVLLKSGVNVRSLNDQQRIKFVSVLSDAEKLDENDSQRLLSPHLDCSNVNCLKHLYCSIQEATEVITSTHEQNGFIIFVDDINVLLNLGVPVHCIQLFVLYLYSLCMNETSHPGVLFMGAVNDDCQEKCVKFLNYISYLVDVKIQVECLETGCSKETDGK